MDDLDVRADAIPSIISSHEYDQSIFNKYIAVLATSGVAISSTQDIRRSSGLAIAEVHQHQYILPELRDSIHVGIDSGAMLLEIATARSKQPFLHPGVFPDIPP